jgi:N-acyl-D-amino-acid deacylase
MKILYTLLVSALVLGTSLLSCQTRPDSEKSVAKEGEQGARAAEFDYLILGATIHDGSGKPGSVGDLAIRGDRIVAMGDLAGKSAKKVIQARGMILGPGFIDLHNHGDYPILRKGLNENLSYVTQGCTTIVTGNCGGGKVDVAPYFRKLKKQGVGVNVVHLIPAGSLRKRAMGADVNRAPSKKELARMRSLAEKAMREGAYGMSTGLIYTPGVFATTAEIIEVAKVVGKHGGIYASHIRGEGDHLLEAIAEAIYIGKQARLPVHISHFKASTPPNWGKVRHSSAMVEEARKNGRKVTADQYPYRASSTSLGALVMPAWVRAGTDADVKARLEDESLLPKIRARIAASYKDRGGADKILIARYRKNEEWNGLTVGQISEQTGKSPVDLSVEIQREGGASAVAFSMSEEDVRYVMKKHWVATASDGSSKKKDSSRPHPRSYGTFSRKIGRFALRQKLIPVEQAIRSSSGLPADILGLQQRGYLRVGAYADVVLLDPASFLDQATFADPHQFSTGVLWLWVNGKVTVKDSEPTHALAGRPIRHADAPKGK